MYVKSPIRLGQAWGLLPKPSVERRPVPSSGTGIGCNDDETPIVCSVHLGIHYEGIITIDQIKAEGYPGELHSVTTEDGYILGLHRIPYGKKGPSTDRRPVVFVMHGLMGASSNFTFLGQKHAIAYNLADAGYDVWLGNARGNIYSRQHTSLNPDDPVEKHAFFDFSWEEIALIDVPTMIDYALAVTGEQSLHYIGHSQGGTTFLVLNSMKPEYNEKFVSAHLLAGVGYMNSFPHTELRAAARLTNTFYTLAANIGVVEIRTLEDIPPGADLLGLPLAPTVSICDILEVDNIIGELPRGFEIGGASLKQFAHYGQNIRDRAFRRWDHGILSNRPVYGSSTPPSYDLTRITVPTTMHYTVGDELLDEHDVLAMAGVMPHAEARKIARESFSHLDFLQATDVKELVTNFLIEKLNRDQQLSASSSLQR